METVGADLAGRRLHPDGRLRIANSVYVAGDRAGPEMHTHLAAYQGEMAARVALGEDVRSDHSAIPHPTYTDPQTSGVGLQLREALESGLDAFEETADYAMTAPASLAEAAGYVTIVVDRANGILLGSFMAAPRAAEAIGEAVLAVKTRVPLDVLADTIHPFPTTARVMGGPVRKGRPHSMIARRSRDGTGIAGIGPPRGANSHPVAARRGSARGLGIS